MTPSYSQRSLMVLSLLGILSAVMSILSVILIFQLQSQHAAVKDSAPSTSVVPAHVWAVLLPVSTVLSALSLTLSLSCVVVCLLHSYFSTEVFRGEHDTDRADWFLLDSRSVRHVAVGLFCLGVSVYLAAMSIYMLLIFEVETGIASACVLSSGILILLVIVIHSLVKASRSARHYHSDRPDTLYQNKHGTSSTPVSCELKVGVDKPRMHRSQSLLQRQVSYPPCANPNEREQHPHQQFCLPEDPQGHVSDKDGYSSGGSYPRMHRTLSTETGLPQTQTLQAQSKPWNGVNNEMRSVLARKTGLSTKDSTLV
ncbi:transmembrane protein 221 [Diretmus argenteus]